MRLLLQIIRPSLIAVVLFVMSLSFTSHLARAQDAEAPPPVAAQVRNKSLLDLYKEGGWVMHLIAATSLGAITVIAYCGTRIQKKKLLPPALQTSLDGALSQQNVSEALRICEKDGSSLSHVIRETFVKAGAGVEVYSKADLEAVASETIFHEETKFMLWVNMLNAFAAVAPMIGLLGTVSGMINSFDQLASGASKPSDFAGGIGEAMVTTAAALLVAIPSMLAYFVFKNMLQSLVGDLSHSASTLINRFVSGAGIDYQTEEA